MVSLGDTVLPDLHTRKKAWDYIAVVPRSKALAKPNL